MRNYIEFVLPVHETHLRPKVSWHPHDKKWRETRKLNPKAADVAYSKVFPVPTTQSGAGGERLELMGKGG